MKEIALWRFIYDQLNNNKPVILLVVLESIGSSPGRQGFKMAVTSSDMIGSIGGGIMEHKFVELAREKLNKYPDETILRRQLHNKKEVKNQSGMICSGEQTIMLFHLGNSHLSVINKIIESLNQNKNGQLKITNDEIYFSKQTPEHDFRFIKISEDEWEYSEKTGLKNILYIIGGGHCALALSELMNKMNFYIHLFEERSDLNTFNENYFVHEKHIVNNFSELENSIPSNENSYVVIMTFGYRTDDVAFRSLVKKDFRYIGILGSKSKLETLLEEWKKDGLPENKLKQLFAPIGLNINSQTPEEIAVSIAAEIISVKNKIMQVKTEMI